MKKLIALLIVFIVFSFVLALFENYFGIEFPNSIIEIAFKILLIVNGGVIALVLVHEYK